jgi:alcohol dehydrogenase class IV
MVSIKLGCSRMHYGKDSISKLQELKGLRRRAFIVMNGTLLKDLGMLDIVTGNLEKAGIEWRTFTDVEEEPSFNCILKARPHMEEFSPDLIVGFGGGSAMDAAKAMWVYYENPKYSDLQDVMPPNVIEKLRVRAELICIPTSAGTGSEATRAAIIKNVERTTKYSVRDMNGRLVPDMAILDPIFTSTLPKALTASTGMDALTHAIESYVALNANPYSDAMAMSSFVNGFGSLRKCYENGNDLESREKMLAASCMGGIAFSNSGLGLTHSIAHTYGAVFNVPHGLANAVVLPYVISYNMQSEAAKGRYDDLARFIGEEDLLNSIVSLRKEIGIPDSFDRIIPDEKSVSDRMDLMIEKAMTDVCTQYNPVRPDEKDIRMLLLQVYHGEKQ